MLPAARSKVRASCEAPRCSPVLPGNIKDILILYEEDAEEWAFYLLEVFSHVVSREGILLYSLASFSLQHLESMSLNFYNCKLLILSNSLLKDLTPKKCQFLEMVLHAPESVVTLLCGVKTSDQLYQLLNISESKWEISTAQEPEDYISVIESVLFKDTEDYLEVITATDMGVSSTGNMSQRKEIEDLPEASISTVPLAVVLPTKIPCENPGEIFIILRDEIIVETVEAEFWSDDMRIRTRPAVWNKKVWCMRALDFPAGLVNVNVYCDGIIKATTEIKYYTIEKAAQCTCRVPDPRGSLCQNDVEELDNVLASVFKHEIPYYEFWPLQTKPYPQEQYTHFEQLPTLLHCAAKFGLKSLAIHLLQCSGATWASQMKNKEGSDPAHIAERCGHEELKKIFEDFAIQEISGINDEESDYEEDFISFSKCSLTSENTASHHESRTHEPSADGAQANRTTGSKHENECDEETQRRPSETGSESSENHYDDLYAVIPDVEPENNLPVPHMSDRPPLPPPRPRTMTAAFQLEKPHCMLQGKMESQMERNQNWCDAGIRKEIGAESKGEEETEEDGPEQQQEEDPYIFAEIDDSEYDTILANMSIKKKSGSRSFIINRPPAPTPRPTYIPPKEETTPYIAQVFQQKAARRQSDGDKLHGPAKNQDRARMESPAFSTLSGCLAAEQEELILLQEKVKNGKMSMDEALEKFKLWQMGKSGLEMIQQEKLRQLRDLIVGKRPEDENTCDKLNIVHHPTGNEVLHNEKLLYSIPFSNKLPARLHVEKEFGFCCRKDH